MTLQPSKKHNSNDGIKRMSDIFDSMYHNILKMGTNCDPSFEAKQDTADSNLLEDGDYIAKRRGEGEQGVRLLAPNRDGEKEEVLRLRRELEKKQTIIRSLEEGYVSPGRKELGTSVEQLQKQVKFLTQNNQSLYRNTYKLEESIVKLKEELTEKNERQKDLQTKVTEYQRQLAFLRKLNKDLLNEQKEIVKSEQKDVTSFNVVRNQFQKEKDILKGKLKLMEIERENDLIGFRKSVNRSTDKYSTLNAPRPNNPSPLITPRQGKDVQLMRFEIEKLKQSVNELSSKKKLTRRKSVSSTPIKRPKV